MNRRSYFQIIKTGSFQLVGYVPTGKFNSKRPARFRLVELRYKFQKGYLEVLLLNLNGYEHSFLRIFKLVQIILFVEITIGIFKITVPPLFKLKIGE